jgi:hypothetical protein
MRAHLESFFEDIQRVKAYEAPGNKQTNMDLLDSFKKVNTPEIKKDTADGDLGES